MFRIPGSKLIPMKEIDSRLDEIDREKEAVLICLAGDRSAELTIDLRKRGFDKVYNLTGGLVAWINQRLPVDRG